jgi:hypothetical protein
VRVYQERERVKSNVEGERAMQPKVEERRSQPHVVGERVEQSKVD